MTNLVRRTTVALALVLTAGATACGPSAPRFMPQDEAAVSSAIAAVPGFILSGAADSWAGGFSQDATFQPANGPVVSGRDGLTAWFKALPPIETVSFGAATVRGEGSLAYATTTYALKFKDIPADTGKQLVVAMRNATGKWEIVAVSFNSDLPVMPPPPAKAPGKAR